jgi:hypothetical protein
MKVSVKLFLSFATLPLLLFGVTDALAQISPATVHYFPQVAAGVAGGTQYATIYSLTNLNSTAANVQMEFFGSNGGALNLQYFNALTEAEIGTGSSFNLVVNPNATVAIYAFTEDALKTGWAKLTSSVPILGLSLFEFGYTSNCPGRCTISQVGVAPTQPLQQSHIFIVSTPQEGTDTGFAVANPGDTAITITASMVDTNGTQISQQSFPLGPRAHIARFPRELFSNLPGDFVGRMVLNSSATYVVMSLFIEDGLMTSFPVYRP